MENFGVTLCIIAYIFLIWLIGYTIYILLGYTGAIIYGVIICLAIGGAVMTIKRY